MKKTIIHADDVESIKKFGAIDGKLNGRDMGWIPNCLSQGKIRAVKIKDDCGVTTYTFWESARRDGYYHLWDDHKEIRVIDISENDIDDLIDILVALRKQSPTTFADAKKHWESVA